MSSLGPYFSGPDPKSCSGYQLSPLLRWRSLLDPLTPSFLLSLSLSQYTTGGRYQGVALLLPSACLTHAFTCFERSHLTCKSGRPRACMPSSSAYTRLAQKVVFWVTRAGAKWDTSEVGECSHCLSRDMWWSVGLILFKWPVGIISDPLPPRQKGVEMAKQSGAGSYSGFCANCVNVVTREFSQRRFPCILFFF